MGLVRSSLDSLILLHGTQWAGNRQINHGLELSESDMPFAELRMIRYNTYAALINTTGKTTRGISEDMNVI